jgi:hypothetical protein
MSRCADRALVRFDTLTRGLHGVVPEGLCPEGDTAPAFSRCVGLHDAKVCPGVTTSLGETMALPWPKEEEKRHVAIGASHRIPSTIAAAEAAANKRQGMASSIDGGIFGCRAGCDCIWCKRPGALGLMYKTSSTPVSRPDAVITPRAAAVSPRASPAVGVFKTNRSGETTPREPSSPRRALEARWRKEDALEAPPPPAEPPCLMPTLSLAEKRALANMTGGGAGVAASQPAFGGRQLGCTGVGKRCTTGMEAQATNVVLG